MKDAMIKLGWVDTIGASWQHEATRLARIRNAHLYLRGEVPVRTVHPADELTAIGSCHMSHS